MTETTVLGACPQDCPDTCSMITTVKDGKNQGLVAEIEAGRRFVHDDRRAVRGSLQPVAAYERDQRPHPNDAAERNHVSGVPQDQIDRARGFAPVIGD